MTDLSKSATIASEVRSALRENGPMSTAQLVEVCHTAEDSRDLSRVIYDLRRSGRVVLDPALGPPGRDGRPAKLYRWSGPPVGFVASGRPKPPLPEVPTYPTQPETHTMTTESIDLTDTALAGLVSLAEQSMLDYATFQLDDDMAWKALRELRAAAQSALTDYRLAKELKAQ